MTHILLTQAQIHQIVDHALRERPHEVCGIIAGCDHQAIQVFPVRNVALDPETRFLMDQHELVQILPQIDRRGLSLLAFYHSHPQGDPVPSATDIREAVYDDVVHLIIGLKNAQPRLSAWHIKRGMVTSVVLHIGDSVADVDSVNLTPAQKTALVIGVLITMLILVVVSLSLLPPAPPIPG